MTNEVSLPIKLSIENLQQIIQELQSKLSTLKIGSTGYKAVSGDIRKLQSEVDKLQNQASKPFITERQFDAASRSVDKIEEKINQLQIDVSRVKFGDLQLSSADQAKLDDFNNKIKQIQTSLTQLKQQAKSDFLASDMGKIWADLNPTAATRSFTQITRNIESAVEAQQKAVKKAEEALNDYQRAMNLGTAAEKFVGAKNPLSAETMGADFSKFFSENKNGVLAFKSGAKPLFEEWLQKNLDIDPNTAHALVQKSANQVKLELQNAESEIRKALQEKITQGTNANGQINGAKAKYDEEYASLTQLKSILEAASTANNKMAESEEKLRASLTTTTTQFNAWKDSVTAAAQSGQTYEGAARKIKAECQNLHSTLASSTAEFLRQQRVLNNFNAIKMTIVNFMGFRQVLNLVKRGVQDALNHIKELDTVMNKISIVTSMSTGDLWQQVDKYSEMAQKYGTSIKGAYEVSQIYYQQGLQTKEVLTLTNETLKLAKISGLDYATTTDYMTTALRGFKMEAEDASRVVDVYSNLAAHTAVSQEELAVAMSKTASSLESVGSSFEEGSAMIGTMVAVTRESATNIGSALKSIAARYGEMKSDPSKLIDSEGEVLAYNKVDAALQSVGITLKDTDGQFRNFTDVIIELGEKWDQLESTQQRYIATQFAGNRQQSRFLALVSNVDLLKSNLNYAEDSEDTGTLQALKSLDSIESKTEQVRVAYQQMYTTIGAEDIWKGFLDGAKNVMETLNGLPKLFGKIPVGAIAMVADFVKVIKDVGLSALGGISKLWDKLLPTETIQQKGTEMGTTLAKTITDAIARSFPALKEAGREAAIQAAEGAKDAQNDATTPAKPATETQRTEAAAPVKTVSTQAVEQDQHVANAAANTAQMANDQERAADAAERQAQAAGSTSTYTIKSSEDLASQIESIGIAETINAQLNGHAIDVDTPVQQIQNMFIQILHTVKDSGGQLHAAFAAASDDAISGYVHTLLQAAGVADAGKIVGQISIQALRDAIGAHSDADETIAAAEDYNGGYVHTITSKIGEAAAAGKAYADASVEAMRQELQDGLQKEIEALDAQKLLGQQQIISKYGENGLTAQQTEDFIKRSDALQAQREAIKEQYRPMQEKVEEKNALQDQVDELQGKKLSREVQLRAGSTGILPEQARGHVSSIYYDAAGELQKLTTEKNEKLAQAQAELDKAKAKVEELEKESAEINRRIGEIGSMGKIEQFSHRKEKEALLERQQVIFGQRSDAKKVAEQAEIKHKQDEDEIAATYNPRMAQQEQRMGHFAEKAVRDYNDSIYQKQQPMRDRIEALDDEIRTARSEREAQLRAVQRSEEALTQEQARTVQANEAEKARLLAENDAKFNGMKEQAQTIAQQGQQTLNTIPSLEKQQAQEDAAYKEYLKGENPEAYALQQASEALAAAQARKAETLKQRMAELDASDVGQEYAKKQHMLEGDWGMRVMNMQALTGQNQTDATNTLLNFAEEGSKEKALQDRANAGEPVNEKVAAAWEKYKANAQQAIQVYEEKAAAIKAQVDKEFETEISGATSTRNNASAALQEAQNAAERRKADQMAADWRQQEYEQGTHPALLARQESEGEAGLAAFRNGQIPGAENVGSVIPISLRLREGTEAEVVDGVLELKEKVQQQVTEQPVQVPVEMKPTEEPTQSTVSDLLDQHSIAAAESDKLGRRAKKLQSHLNGLEKKRSSHLIGDTQGKDHWWSTHKDTEGYTDEEYADVLKTREALKQTNEQRMAATEKARALLSQATELRKQQEATEAETQPTAAQTANIDAIKAETDAVREHTEAVKTDNDAKQAQQNTSQQTGEKKEVIEQETDALQQHTEAVKADSNAQQAAKLEALQKVKEEREAFLSNHSDGSTNLNKAVQTAKDLGFTDLQLHPKFIDETISKVQNGEEIGTETAAIEKQTEAIEANNQAKQAGQDTISQTGTKTESIQQETAAIEEHTEAVQADKNVWASIQTTSSTGIMDQRATGFDLLGTSKSTLTPIIRGMPEAAKPTDAQLNADIAKAIAQTTVKAPDVVGTEEKGAKAGSEMADAQDAEFSSKPAQEPEVQGASEAGAQAGEKLSESAQSAFKPPELSNTAFNVFDQNGIQQTVESITAILEKIGTVSEEQKAKLLELFNTEGKLGDFVTEYNKVIGTDKQGQQNTFVAPTDPVAAMAYNNPMTNPMTSTSTFSAEGSDASASIAQMQALIDKMVETKAISEETGTALKAMLEGGGENPALDTLSALIDKLVEVGVLSADAGAKYKAMFAEASPEQLAAGIQNLTNAIHTTGDAAEQAGAKLSKMNFSTLGSAIRMLASISGLSKQAKGAITLLGGAVTAFGVVVSLIDKKTKTMAATNPWMAIAMAVMALWNGITMLIETPEQRLERLNKKAEELGNKAKELNSSLKTLETGKTQLEELEKKRYDSSEAAEEYQKKVEELASAFPELISGFDEAGQVIIETREMEDALADARERTARATFDAAKAEQAAAVEAEKQARSKAVSALDTVASSAMAVSHEHGNYGAAGTLSTTITGDEKSAVSMLFGHAGFGNPFYDDEQEWDQDWFNERLPTVLEQARSSGTGTLSNKTKQWIAGYYGTQNGFTAKDFVEYLEGRESEGEELTPAEMGLIKAYRGLESFDESELTEKSVSDVQDSDLVAITNAMQAAIKRGDRDTARAKSRELKILQSKLNKQLKELEDNADEYDEEEYNARREELVQNNKLISEAMSAYDEYEVATNTTKMTNKKVATNYFNSEFVSSDFVTDKTGLSSILGANYAELFTKKVQEVFAETGETYTWDDFEAEYGGEMLEAGVAADTFWTNLLTYGEEKSQRFIKMIKNISDYRLEDFSEFEDIDGWGDIQNELSETIARRRKELWENLYDFSEQDSSENWLTWDEDQKKFFSLWRQAGQQVETSQESSFLKAIYKKQQALRSSGDYASAKAYGQQSLKLFNTIIDLPRDIRSSVWDYVEQYGIDTEEGLDNIVTAIKGNKNISDEKKEELIGFFTDMKEEMPKNLSLAVQAYTQSILDNWSDQSKILKKLTSGVDMKDAEDIIQKAQDLGLEDFSLDDFVMDGDKLVLSADAAKRYWTAFFDKQDSLAEGWETSFNTAYEKLFDDAGKVDIDFDSFDINTYNYFKDLGVPVEEFLSWDEKTSSYVFKEGQSWETLVKTAEELAPKTRENIERLKQYNKWQREYITKSANWNEGDYSSIKADTGQDITELMKLSDKEITALSKDNPDVKTAVTKAQKATSNLLKDLTTKPFNEIDFDSYEGLPDSIKAEIKGKSDDAVYDFVKKYVKSIGVSISESNDLILAAYEKQQGIDKYSTSAIKDLSFISGSQFTATSNELKEFANRYDLDLAQLIDNGIAVYDAAMGEWVVDYTKIDKFDTSKIEGFQETVQDSIDSFFEKLAKLVTDGLNGALSNVDRKSLEEQAKKYGIFDLEFVKTNGGWELTLESSSKLLAAMAAGDASVAEMNKLAMAQFNKEVRAYTTDDIKDLTFIDQNHFTATSDELLTFAEKFNLNLYDLMQKGIITWNKQLGEYVVDYTKIDGLDLSQIEGFQATVQDSMDAFWKELGDLVSKGISGSLTNMEYEQLEKYAQSTGFKGKLNYSRTKDGLKLTDESQLAIYSHLKTVNGRQAAALYPELSESFKSSNEHYKTASANEARIRYLEGELSTIRASEVSSHGYQTKAGNVDLVAHARHQKSGAQMQAAGWTEVPTNSYSTLYSSTRSGADYGLDTNVVVNVTPITNDGKEILSPEDLDDYVAGLMEGGGTAEDIKLRDTKGLIMDAWDVDVSDAEALSEGIKSASDEAIRLHNESDAIAANIEEWDKPNNARIEQYERELELAKEIAAERATTEDSSFDFMNNDIPAAQNNPITYFENWGKAWKTIKDSFSTSGADKGLIGYQDFYNIMTEMGHIAEVSGQPIKLGANKFVTDAESAAALINEGAQCLTVASDGSIKVDLSKFGLDFEGSADEMADNIDTGIKAIAKSQIEMLDSMIQLMETIVAMEKLGDVDVDNSGTIDLGEIFEVTYEDDGKTIKAIGDFTTTWKESVGKLIAWANTKEGEDFKKAAQDMKIKWGEVNTTMWDLLNTSEADIQDWSKEMKGTYAAIIGAFYAAAKSGDYDPDNILASIRDVIAGTGFEGEIEIGGMKLAFKYDAAFEIGEDGKIHVGEQTFDYTDSGMKAASKYQHETSLDALKGAASEYNAQTGEVTFKDSIVTSVDYNVDKGTYHITFSDGSSADADSEAGANLAIATYAKMKGTEIGNTEDTSAEPVTFTIHQKGKADLLFTVEDGKVEVETQGSGDGTGATEAKAKAQEVVDEQAKKAAEAASGTTGNATIDKLNVELTGDATIEVDLTGKTMTVTNSPETVELSTVPKLILPEATTEITLDLTGKTVKGTAASAEIMVPGGISTLATGSVVSLKNSVAALANASALTVALTEITTKSLAAIEDDTISIDSDISNVTVDAADLTVNVVPGYTPIGLSQDAVVKIDQAQATIADASALTISLTEATDKSLAGQENDIEIDTLDNVKAPTSKLEVVLSDSGIVDLTEGTVLSLTSAVNVLGTAASLLVGIGEWTNVTPDLGENEGPLDIGEIPSATAAVNTLTIGEYDNLVTPDEINGTATITATVDDQATEKLEKVQGKAEDVEVSDPNVDVSENNAKETQSKLEKVASAANSIPTSRTVNISLNLPADFETKIDTFIKKIKEVAKTWQVKFEAKKTGSWPSDVTGTPWARGNVGQAMASGNTLMGELGPELVVQKGRYFVVGQTGAEFVDLAPDAIVFNHLQTEQLLKNGMSSERGRAVTNERTAAAFAKGNMNGGPAMASASAALSALKQLRSMWQSLLSASVQDLAGAGGSGGGGGGSSNNNFIKELEKWYNWLQKIAQLEEDINYQESIRNRITSEWAPSGKDYYDSQKKSLSMLEEQLKTQRDLTASQQDYFEQRRAELNSDKNPFNSLYEFDENGQLKYKNGALSKLSYLSGTNSQGKPNMTAKEQYEYITKTLGIDASYLKYDSSGNEIESDDYASMVQAFWDKMDSDKEEMQSLHDSVQDGYQKIEELQQAQNELMKEMRDNQMEVETKVYDAIVDMRERAIEKLEDTKDAISDSNEKFITGLTDALKNEQNMYDNADSRKELDQLRRKRDVLMRSGGSAAEISSLNDEISDKERTAYFDKQQEEIDAIQAASDKQIEKLEAQIELETEILDYQKKYGLLWAEVTDIMSRSPEEIADFIATNDSEYWDKSPIASADALNQLRFATEQWVSYRDDGGLQSDIGEIKKAVSSSNDGDSGGGSSGSDGSGGSGGSGGSSGSGSSGSGGGVTVTSTSGWKTDSKSHWKEQTLSNGKTRIISKGNHSGGTWMYGAVSGRWDKRCSTCGYVYAVNYGTKKPTGYASGGMNYETGTAMLHGTNTKPEAVLNADQTKVLRNNILSNKPNSLISLLKSYNEAYQGLSSNAYDSISNSSTSTQIDKAEINLNIDKLANDYDARQAANTIMDEMLRIASKTKANNSVRR